MDDLKGDHSNLKRPTQRNCFKQILTHNVPIDDVESTNGTN